MAFWLIKSEPDVYSIDDMCRDKKTIWHGVRNYQARNFMRAMQPGEKVLFYHSSVEPLGIAGLVEVSKAAVADPSQFERGGDCYDPKASPESPRWFCPEMRFARKFKSILPLQELKSDKRLAKMVLLQRGSRLSVQPVADREFEVVLNLAGER